MSQLYETNATLDFYCDFEKIQQNVEDIAISLNTLNYGIEIRTFSKCLTSLLQHVVKMTRCICFQTRLPDQSRNYSQQLKVSCNSWMRQDWRKYFRDEKSKTLLTMCLVLKQGLIQMPGKTEVDMLWRTGYITYLSRTVFPAKKKSNAKTYLMSKQFLVKISSVLTL